MAKGTPDQQNRINSTGRSTEAAKQQTNKRNLCTASKISVNGTPDPYGINSIGRSIDVARKDNKPEQIISVRYGCQ